MKKTIYSRYDKNAITKLPVEGFEGRVIVILNEADAEKAVDYLLSADILGMDTETRPAFKRGLTYKVALLQVSTRDTCFLFRINLIGLCPAIIRLLENTRVPMVALSWSDDLRMLHQRGDFTPGRFYEIQDMVGDIGVKDLSLQKLYANLFGYKISKRQRLTNWESPILTDMQKRYAATDAWACIRLYEEIVRLRDSHHYDLVEVKDPEPPQPKKEPDVEVKLRKKTRSKVDPKAKPQYMRQARKSPTRRKTEKKQ